MQFKLKSSIDTSQAYVKNTQTKRTLEKIKLCRKSLPFASLAECGVNSDVYNKPFEIACEDIVFKFENDFKSNIKIILTREDVVLKLVVPQITGSFRRPVEHLILPNY